MNSMLALYGRRIIVIFSLETVKDIIVQSLNSYCSSLFFWLMGRIISFKKILTPSRVFIYSKYLYSHTIRITFTKVITSLLALFSSKKRNKRDTSPNNYNCFEVLFAKMNITNKKKLGVYLYNILLSQQKLKK
jgi:hypothetical protein